MYCCLLNAQADGFPLSTTVASWWHSEACVYVFGTTFSSAKTRTTLEPTALTTMFDFPNCQWRIDDRDHHRNRKDRNTDGTVREFTVPSGAMACANRTVYVRLSAAFTRTVSTVYGVLRHSAAVVFVPGCSGQTGCRCASA